MGDNLGQQPATYVPLDQDILANGTSEDLQLYWDEWGLRLSPDDQVILLERMKTVHAYRQTAPRNPVQPVNAPMQH